MVKTAQQLLPERYHDVERIASGGMGEILRANDSVLGRSVAVKLLGRSYAADERLRSRFRREALAAARLSGDRNTVTIYDVGEWDGRPYIVMEYLRGGTLEQRLFDAGPPPPAQALDWLDQAARALDHAHREGVVHRDVKPGNLLLDDRGDVHVGDFGIASATGFDSLTMTGTVLGTAGYLAPEQAQGSTATAASDRYALGVVAFELLTGTRPFAADSVTAEAAAHVTAPVPDASARAPELPREVDVVLKKALAKEPRDRYASNVELVAALRDAFDRAADETRAFAVAPAVSGLTLAPLWTWLAAAAALTLLGGIALAGVVSSGGHEPAASALAVPGTTLAATPQTTIPATTAPTTTAAAVAPSAGDVLSAQGAALLQQGDAAAALPVLEQAVRALSGAGPADPAEATANYDLGVALTQLGRCPEAVPYFERAVQLAPASIAAQQMLAAAESCVQPAPPASKKHDHGKHKGRKKQD